ncbi:hypothetical protein [Clostridium sp. AM58-1XD]|uniref:hypothetical protein n=1 Tax=Clostridium sp. AM58-1XD TaxID=2292307 RepID=UPI000E4ABE07|nr:hypothetical protein [Clostridium sp. AM58-1XD]RGY95373.1 hypothetical protein DXA13_19325 [Clostridium sp. AM58-1XD]
MTDKVLDLAGVQLIWNKTKEYINSRCSGKSVYLRSIVVNKEDFGSTLTAYIQNSQVKQDSIVHIYFAESSIRMAQKASIIGSTEDGRIVLKALKLPEGNLTIDVIEIKQIGG